MKPAPLILTSVFLLFATAVIYFVRVNNSSRVETIAANTIPTTIVVPTNIPSPISPPAPTVQVLQATYGPPFGFSPPEFTVKAGIPVRLEVAATENGRGCMGSITLPGLNEEIQVFRQNQTNIFEFTPTSPGEYFITCAMGIPHATITVI